MFYGVCGEQSAHLVFPRIWCTDTVPNPVTPSTRAVSLRLKLHAFLSPISIAMHTLGITTHSPLANKRVEPLPRAASVAICAPTIFDVVNLGCRDVCVAGISERDQTNTPLACDERNIKRGRIWSSAAMEQGTSLYDPFSRYVAMLQGRVI
jgi:hypothetical protein